MQLHGYLHTVDPHLGPLQAQARPAISAEAAAEAAADHVMGLVAAGEISEVWLDAEPSAPTLRRIAGEDAWSVDFRPRTGTAGRLSLFLNGSGNALLSFREAKP